MARNFPDDPLWFKDAIIYELHVKAFADSNGDGIGDFVGLRQRLDYLQNLGITAIWLLPFYPSPLRDDGYDIADYTNINSDYGTLKDFKEFLNEAHDRGLRVITELVLNHTSDQHAWFQRSRTAPPGSAWRNYYVWSDTPDRYRDARIIFQDFEHSNWSWDPVAKAYFWHRFYSHQPDLNFDNPQVHKALFKVLDFWFRMGIDGLRLDAVPYLYEREGTNCENLPETYKFLEDLRAFVSSRYPDRMLLAEANQWPEDAVAYFGDGNRCHMAFHFPLMPRMFMSLQMEDRFPVVDILDQTPAIPDNCQWALFLRNHDELTLEMVTDEERDYMYKMYARDPRARINLGIRRRLAPLLGNDRKKIELMNVMLFTLPGAVVLYYGDELGMGDNYYLGDRDGVRTPMQWSPDRNAGFSKCNPQRLYLPVIIDPEYHYESINVENQSANEISLLWWTRHLIAMRRAHRALSRGEFNFLSPDNSKVLAYVRKLDSETILVVVNLSRHSQLVTLDLREFEGCRLEEIFSRNIFPPVREGKYTLTLQGYGYFIFQVCHASDDLAVEGASLPTVPSDRPWDEFFLGMGREEMERSILAGFLRTCRWFGAKARTVRATTILDVAPLGPRGEVTLMVLVRVEYTEGPDETYFLPMSLALGEEAVHLEAENPRVIICRVALPDGREGLAYDGVHDQRFCRNLLASVTAKRRVAGLGGRILAERGRDLTKFLREAGLKDLADVSPTVVRSEQSNSSILFGDLLILKLFRKIEEGPNPDIEVSRFLTEKAGYPNTPSFEGALEYRRSGSKEPMALAVLQRFVPNQGDAWQRVVESLSKYFERVLTQHPALEFSPGHKPILEMAEFDFPSELQDLFGGIFFQMAELLGHRTAEMHLALASDTSDPAFAPAEFSTLYQRSIYQSMQTLTRRTLALLRQHLESLAPDTRADAEAVLADEKKILAILRQVTRRKFTSLRIRTHGDFHLGQVLYTGKDLFIIDFEGEPARPINERRLKRSPLRDVAGMIRSLYYAPYTALFQYREGHIRRDDIPELEPWAELWYRCASGAFLRAYKRACGNAALLPQDPEELRTMLRAFLLEKAVYEIGYELNNRPGWLRIPLRGVRSILEEEE